MKNIALLLITVASISAHATNNIDLTNEDDFKLLTTIMKTSECNTYSSLYKFQQENNVPNGDEFIDKFMSNEARKKNSTLIDMSSDCQKALLDFAEITSSKN
ncbi:hypothetical protein [Proteus appendicitidis]|uniref:Uncharacterized protein n=1 Tax=Proteus appendicitidis TaxID=3034648 RepID=A0ABY8Y424_9GAMM|nr:hypothetical protein [Proteus sp. HZ0627]WIV87123.1 hypothetical protein QQS39_11605 [Proteus sp. HZ0627]